MVLEGRTQSSVIKENGNNNNKKAQQSATLEELAAIKTFSGVANIPNQVHYLHAKAKLNLNIMLFGEVGLGKTGLINSMLGEEVFQDGLVGEAVEGRVQIRIRKQELEETGTTVALKLIDIPNMGHFVTKKAAGPAALEYLHDQHSRTLVSESQLKRPESQRIDDSRVHAVLYFHNPVNEKLSQVDVQLITEMSRVTNVLIVIAKGDTLLRHEVMRIKKNIKDQLANVKIFGVEDSNEPFLCISGAAATDARPRRHYPWGSVSLNPNSPANTSFTLPNSTSAANLLNGSLPHSNSSSLNINILVEQLFLAYLPELVLRTESKYEQWRSRALKAINFNQQEWKEPAEAVKKITEGIQALEIAIL